MSIVKVKDNPDLVRDTESGAILNTNNEGLSAYKKRKKQQNRINNLEDKVESMDAKLDKLLEFIYEKF
jgi:tetrahydromethanopterin S-methyltransferase subunit B